MSYYGGSYIKTLIDLFPELKLEESKFAMLPSINNIIIHHFMIINYFECRELLGERREPKTVLYQLRF